MFPPPHTCDVEILANFSQKIEKSVKITLENAITKNFPDFFCHKKAKIRSRKKNNDLNHV